jgi:hypothetical protein
VKAAAEYRSGISMTREDESRALPGRILKNNQEFPEKTRRL